MSAQATPMSARSATGRQGVPASAAVLRQAPDERLVALVRDGSAAAFEEISARYRRRLHVYCVRLVGPAHAEDVVQQALLRAYLSLRRGDLRHVALRAWLYRIARNCAIDLLRSRPPEHEQLDLEFDGVPQPPRLVEQKEEIGTLVSAMRELPEGQRRALTLSELEGRSYSEISAELGQTGPGVRQLIFRARETPAVRPRRARADRIPAPNRRHPAADRGRSPRSDGGQALERRRPRGGRCDGSRDDHAARPARPWRRRRPLEPSTRLRPSAGRSTSRADVIRAARAEAVRARDAGPPRWRQSPAMAAPSPVEPESSVPDRSYLRGGPRRRALLRTSRRRAC